MPCGQCFSLFGCSNFSLLFIKLIEYPVPVSLVLLLDGDLLGGLQGDFVSWRGVVERELDDFRLDLEGAFNVLEVVLGVRMCEISGVGGGGRNRSLIVAFPSVDTRSSGCIRPAMNSSSLVPNTLLSSDLESTTDWEPSG